MAVDPALKRELDLMTAEERRLRGIGRTADADRIRAEINAKAGAAQQAQASQATPPPVESGFGFPTRQELLDLTQQRAAQVRSERQQDIAEAQPLAQKEFAEGSLGRVREGRSQEFQDLINQRQSMALGSDEALMKAQEAAQKNLDIQSQTAIRQLKGELGNQGIRGGINLEQQFQVLGQRGLAESQLQSELAQQRLNQQERGLSGLESSLLSAEESELQRSLVNEQRALQERLGRVTLPLQFAQLGASERAAASQEVTSTEMLRAQLAAQQEANEIARIEAEKPPAESKVVGGGKILCGFFAKRGDLSLDLYSADLEYAESISEYTKIGYRLWAQYLIKVLEKSSLLRAIIKPIVLSWAKEMAHRVGRAPQGSILGNALSIIGEPICNIIGRIKCSLVTKDQ